MNEDHQAISSPSCPTHPPCLSALKAERASRVRTFSPLPLLKHTHTHTHHKQTRLHSETFLHIAPDPPRTVALNQVNTSKPKHSVPSGPLLSSKSTDKRPVSRPIACALSPPGTTNRPTWSHPGVPPSAHVYATLKPLEPRKRTLLLRQTRSQVPKSRRRGQADLQTATAGPGHFFHAECRTPMAMSFCGVFYFIVGETGTSNSPFPLLTWHFDLASPLVSTVSVPSLSYGHSCHHPSLVPANHAVQSVRCTCTVL
ncbi:uncharacterized protein LY79DRAFT_534624 [Colletotrichum navitas]|uniref:Uncharacterized protein n=1 Tax=Colletotrichum navitas TaxID=681940 RepID=A0AAD8QDR8_9PEZI|nr:uncharacterized protein LY79DRAFT_534624 [Colletotrichum navitas]KAK1600772.1 hypothetical protein LY79DRAFT_534624 [Colletotrichum navitas]